MQRPLPPDPEPRREREAPSTEARWLLDRLVDGTRGESLVGELLELRMRKLLARGDRAGALAAFRRCERWLRATSDGGPRRRELLVTALGFDPDLSCAPELQSEQDRDDERSADRD